MMAWCHRRNRVGSSLRTFARLLVACLLACAPAQAQADRTALAHQLFDQEHWEELVRFLQATPDRSPELDYEYGVALAHLERWDESRQALEAGRRLAPADKRFSLELAGVAFKQKNYAASAEELHRALRLDPQDGYANDFLATVYYLQSNTEAAVKYWNRVEAGGPKPEVAATLTDPPLRLQPALLDHAFAFSPASTLRLSELRATERRLDNLEVLPVSRVELVARPEGKFDAVLHAQESNGFGATKLEALLRTFRGLPFQEVTPEYFNFRHAAINLISLERWDPDKRRALISVSGPFGLRSTLDPRGRYRLTLDARNENWDIRNEFTGPAPVLASLNMRRTALSAEIIRLAGWRWKWSAGAEVSRRDYRNLLSQEVIAPEFLVSGFELKQTASLEYQFLRIPERRLTATAAAGSQTARVWSEPAHAFEKVQGSVDIRWLPRAKGDDYETRWQARAGRTFGQIPFDELAMLGLDRDTDLNDLRLRAHPGVRDGRKGSAPLGRNYFVASWETDKNLYSNGLLAVKLGPFVDTGTIKDPSSPVFGSQKWLCDTGAQAKLRVLGLGVAFSYGKDLRTGNNAFFTTVMR
jgi:tetratricopeptide (TPR) repeat protein